MRLVSLLCLCSAAVVSNNMAITAKLILLGAILFAIDYIVKRKRTYKGGNLRKFSYK